MVRGDLGLYKSHTLKLDKCSINLRLMNLALKSGSQLLGNLGAVRLFRKMGNGIENQSLEISNNGCSIIL